MKRLLTLVALGLGATLVLGACGTGIGGGYAAKVSSGAGDDHRSTVIKTSDLNDELAAVRDNKEYLDALSQGASILGKGGKYTFDSNFVSSVVNRRVIYALIEQELGRKGITVS